MPQSNVIFAFLFVAFLVWVTMKGELATYLNFLLRPVAGTPDTTQTATPKPSQSDATPSGSMPNVATALQGLEGAGAALSLLA